MPTKKISKKLEKKPETKGKPTYGNNGKVEYIGPAENADAKSWKNLGYRLARKEK